MTFEVKIIEDSIFNGSRLTTFQLKYPRFIHSEFMTHRVFSRNASSSRAIPVSKMIEQVRNDPATPIHWGMNERGMQASKELQEDEAKYVQGLWKDSAILAASLAERMEKLNAHKQVVNRILEPFQWISVVCTATEYQNFFDLRCHKDAQPEIQHLANMMKEAYTRQNPKELKEGIYHLPYVSEEERQKFNTFDLVKMSAARCARVSYLTHDGKNPSPEKDFELYERLVGSVPIHASPTEHQAKPNVEGPHGWYSRVHSGNFSLSWMQFRKFLEYGEKDLF